MTLIDSAEHGNKIKVFSAVDILHVNWSITVHENQITALTHNLVPLARTKKTGIGSKPPEAY